MLEPDRAKGDAPYLLRQDGGVLRLVDDSDHLVVDVWEVERLLAAADAATDRREPSVALEALLGALGNWRGDCLADAADEEWAHEDRRQISDRLVAAAGRAGELLVASGRFGEAIDLAGRALAAEPWSERAYRVLIGAHLGGGDRSAALSSLESCRAMLEDLGHPPDPATEALARRVAEAG